MALSTIFSLNASQGTNSLLNTITFTPNEQVNINLTTSANITTSATNVAFAMSFTKTKLQYFYALCDQPVTLYTNQTSGASPQDTIVLTSVCGNWYGWFGQVTNPFGGNVTAAYVSNNGTAAVTNLNIWFGLTAP